ncbi:MAG: hypothetical protein WD623_17300 [Marinobacter sp.]|uniref:hypothetical protein n=1 Tax=Marinobacter sp. TaxID=50741 RepID=UPI00349FDB12
MDRRTLLASLSAAAIWLSISSCARLLPDGRLAESGDLGARSTSLTDQLAELADPIFRDYSEGRSVETLQAEMMYKGVISTRHGINHQKVNSLARHEPLIRYKGFYYTQTEIELYALAYLYKDRVSL